MTRAGPSAYPIGTSSRRCAATGRDLLTGEAYVAALVQSPDSDDIRREDFSAASWDAGARPRKPLAMIGFWRGTVHEPGAGKKRFLLIDDAALLELFEQTGEDLEGVGHGSDADFKAAAEADRLAFRFVLALLLMRKRLLIHERNTPIPPGGGGGRPNLLVRVKGEPRPEGAGTPGELALIEVVDPGLDEAAILRVTQQLRAVLSDDASAPQPANQPVQGSTT